MSEFRFYPYVVEDGPALDATCNHVYKFEKIKIEKDEGKIEISLSPRKDARLGAIVLTDKELVQLRTDITKFLIEQGYH